MPVVAFLGAAGFGELGKICLYIPGAWRNADELNVHRVPKKLSRFVFVRTSSNLHKFR